MYLTEIKWLFMYRFMYLNKTLWNQKKLLILIQLSSLRTFLSFTFFDSTSCLWPRHLIQCDASQASWRNMRKSPQTEISSEPHVCLHLQLSWITCSFPQYWVHQNVCYILNMRIQCLLQQADFTEHTAPKSRHWLSQSCCIGSVKPTEPHCLHFREFSLRIAHLTMTE